MSDELDRLRRARPLTSADDGWAASVAGAARLAAVQAAVRSGGADRTRMRAVLHRPRVARGAALTSLTAAAVAVLVLGVPAATGPGGSPTGPVAAPRMALAAFPDCAAMRTALRKHTARHVGQYGLVNPGGPMLDLVRPLPVAVPVAAPVARAAANESTGAAPTHSGTNDQVAGVDEPDIVKTDGTRIVAVSGGVLRVVDVADRRITGRLDLRRYPGAYEAQLLVSGNRALVVLPPPPSTMYRGGPVVLTPFGPRPYPNVPDQRTTLALVDLTGAPRIISTARVQGSYVDARLSDGIVRVVAESTPRLHLPVAVGRNPRPSEDRRLVRQAPLSDWLPRYSVTTAAGTTVTRRVPCTAVEHPIRYTGTSMLTVYSVDMAGGLHELAPISVATDAATVYGDGSSLFVAAVPRYGQPEARTQIHRFDVSRPGRPVYLGSATVSGQPLNSYALDADGAYLRVATTVPPHPGTPATTRVSIVDTRTLKVVGTLDGLGRGQQVEAVRFAGPRAYVVTYRSLDPLYVLDLSDPTAPREVGELHVTGYSDYLHPVADGRLLGVGRTVRGREPDGVQVSLFDVSDPANPQRLSRVSKHGSPDAAGADSHAFLYWPATGTAVVPLQDWNGADAGAALVVHVGTSTLRLLGTIGGRRTGTGRDPIERSLVIGDQLWTMSGNGLNAYDLASLQRQGAVAFR